MKLEYGSGDGLVFLECKKKRFGYYSHKDCYRNTDLIITPLSIWTNWDHYYNAIGNNQLNNQGGKNGT
jgi:hypothetical protein